MDEIGYDYYEVEGEVVFYGFKFDVQVKMVIGKEEILLIVQFDFFFLECFDFIYVGEDGKQYCFVVIYCGVVLMMECFVVFLIEEYKGVFLIWFVLV